MLEETRVSTLLRHVDAPRPAAASFWHRQRQEPFFQIRGDGVDVDGLRQHERAGEATVTAFDPMVLLAGDSIRRALAADDHAALLGLNVDVLALQAGKF